MVLHMFKTRLRSPDWIFSTESFMHETDVSMHKNEKFAPENVIKVCTYVHPLIPFWTLC